MSKRKPYIDDYNFNFETRKTLYDLFKFALRYETLLIEVKEKFYNDRIDLANIFYLINADYNRIITFNDVFSF